MQTKLLLLGLFLSLQLSAQKKPNVIVIMTDDMGNNIEALGNPWLKTPNLNKLHDESAVLTNFHQAIMCTPSRAGLMTGKYAVRTGAWRTSVGRSNMRPEEVTMAEVFKANGYRTGQFGKWHLGDVWPFTANDQGFDETVNFKCGGISQISDYWGNDYFDDTYYHNGKPKKYKGYCTDVFFNETIRYIKEKPKDPFFIYLATNVTHLPAIVSEAYQKPWLDKGHVKKQAIYYGMITNLDENMGRLQQALNEEGIADDTIIVFTTDDGTAGYAAQFDKNGWAKSNGFNMGQRGGKGSAYEGGHRLFAFVKWKNGKIQAGKKIDQLTTVFDIFPTLKDLCQLKKIDDLDQDGISFKPALYGKNIPGNKERTVVLSKFNPAKPDTFKRNKFCVIQGDWRFVNQSELYNVKTDRLQKNDIAAQHPQIVTQMKAELKKFIQNNAQNREEPVRFVLGDQQHKTIELTTQDLWEKSAFSQGHVQKMQEGKGPWKVLFKNKGDYQITLSRFPLYTELPINKKFKKKSENFEPIKATLTINGKTYEKEIDKDANKAVFNLKLNAEKADLEARFYSNTNKSIPSYYLQVSKL